MQAKVLLAATLVLASLLTSPCCADHCAKLSCRTAASEPCHQREFCDTEAQACVRCTDECQVLVRGNATLCRQKCPGWLSSCVGRKRYPPPPPGEDHEPTHYEYSQRIPDGMIIAFVLFALLIVVIVSYRYRHEIWQLICCHYHCPRPGQHRRYSGPGHHHHNYQNKAWFKAAQARSASLAAEEAAEAEPMNPDEEKTGHVEDEDAIETISETERK